MKLSNTLAALGVALTASLPTTRADAASIVAALDKVAAAAASLNNTILAWDGGLLGTLPILAESAALLDNINEGTTAAKQSANLSDIDAVSVAVATLSLSAGVNQTLRTIVTDKYKFKDLLIAPVILLDLELDKSATDQFSAAIVEKVPAALQPIAEELVAGIDAAFDQAIDAYNLLSDI